MSVVLSHRLDAEAGAEPLFRYDPDPEPAPERAECHAAAHFSFWYADIQSGSQPARQRADQKEAQVADPAEQGSVKIGVYVIRLSCSKKLVLVTIFDQRVHVLGLWIT